MCSNMFVFTVSIIRKSKNAACVLSNVLPLLSNRFVSGLIGNVGPSVHMIGLSFNMAATNHTNFKNGMIVKC